MYIYIYTTHCNTMQHNATHCNTLQHSLRITRQEYLRSILLHVTQQQRHTTTHSNTQQHTATHSNTLQHIATLCNALQHTATHYEEYQAGKCQRLPAPCRSAPLECLSFGYLRLLMFFCFDIYIYIHIYKYMHIYKYIHIYMYI